MTIKTAKRFYRKVNKLFGLYIRKKIPKEQRAKKIFENQTLQEIYEGIHEGAIITKPMLKAIYIKPFILFATLLCHFIYKLFT